jgi:hypothetical protein
MDYKAQKWIHANLHICSQLFLSIRKGKRSFFNKVLRKLNSHMHKNETEPYLTSWAKIKMSWRFKHKSRNYKTTRRKQGKTTWHWRMISNIWPQKGRQQKEKYISWG